ncbi:MAG: DUF6880 family protein, partial [Methylocella sp.]
FRKLVAAALAATKGPAAVAAIIDKRLAGLDRAKAFVDWEKAKAFTADIAATVATITGELASADPGAAVDRLVRFLTTNLVFGRIDDSSGRLQDVYHEAAAALPDLIGRLKEVDKASIPDRLFALAVSDDYGFFSTIMPELVARLPAHGVDRWGRTPSRDGAIPRAGQGGGQGLEKTREGRQNHPSTPGDRRLPA